MAQLRTLTTFARLWVAAATVVAVAAACGGINTNADGGAPTNVDGGASDEDGGLDGRVDAGRDSGIDGAFTRDGGAPDGTDCRVDADCPAHQYCRFQGYLCPGSSVNFTIPVPGHCVTPSCGERRCEGEFCATSEDCSPEEACGVFTESTCEYRGHCLIYVECNDPGCSIVWVPGPNCDYCLCDACPDSSDGGVADGGSSDGGGLEGGSSDGG